MKNFCKMQGLGNDFVVLNALETAFDWTPAQIARLADRHRGIGFDQLLIVEPPPSPDFDFAYRIFNADGSEVEHCGNGARCFGLFVRRAGLSNKDRYRVAVKRGAIEIAYVGEQAGVAQFRVAMGQPQIAAVHETITWAEQSWDFACLNLGNPHAVTFVEQLETAPVAELGAFLQCHPLFPERVNVGFAQCVAQNRLRLRVFERGVGETQACGTGACAAAVAAMARGLVTAKVQVEMRGGTLEIAWTEGGEVWMTGAAEHVYDGRLP